jgi:hypothetical protein
VVPRQANHDREHAALMLFVIRSCEGRSLVVSGSGVINDDILGLLLDHNNLCGKMS